MDQERLLEVIESTAKALKLDALLCQAIAMVESNMNVTAVRFEPEWCYFVSPDKYAFRLGITEKTERILQQMSYNGMQVMGSVARELGYGGSLLLLVQPQLGIFYACKKLSLLCKKYSCEMDIISAYNQGGPYLNSLGLYKNQKYVDRVLKELKALRDGEKKEEEETEEEDDGR